ncbi:hypothetical protein [Neisseria shayeganii]|uniref:Uncharacterized protein n=1 Tax=Neisseria shayeganii TaxID=607712 RepID=A0A7D7NA53_9NEIS|nr:hypothetical protein [Neisseria shayeganii]QMT41017.1 hypothetical protein H3L94_02930 [Neisseria shayeganii]
MKFSRRKTALLSLWALIPWTAHSETLAPLLPDHIASLEIYAAGGNFQTYAPYRIDDVNGIPGLKSMAGGGVLVRHITIQDAALRDATLARLRAVRIQPVESKIGYEKCQYRANPLGAWMLGGQTMLVLWQPVDFLKLGGNSTACLQVGDKAHWFQVSDAEIWQALQPLWQP